MGVYLGHSKPKARKLYRCGVCWEKIEVGEQHYAYRGIGDEGPFTMRMHFECEFATRSRDQMDWECSIPGDMSRKECKDIFKRANGLFARQDVYATGDGNKGTGEL